MTHPVRCGSVTSRAFFNVEAALVQVGRAGSIEAEKNRLMIQKGSLGPDLCQGAQIQLGELGAETVSKTDPVYRVVQVRPWQDPLESEVLLDGGAE